MLLPLLLLPWAWGALAASPPVPPGSLTLRLLKTTIFYNASSSNVEGMALLGDLETHFMDCSTCRIRFLQPWAHQGLTPRQWQDLETMFHGYLSKFILLMNKVVKDEGEHYPFVIQVSIGCELHLNGTSRQFCDAAVNGEDFISFNMDSGTWVAQHEGKLALKKLDFLNQDKSTSATVQFLLRTTCVSELQSFGQYGKESLARQERPVAVVFARAPPPAGTPAPLLLVCRVTGFYPRPIRVAWLQDGEEVGPGGAAELQRDPAQRGPDLPAAQLPGRGAGRRAQLRLPGGAQQPGGPEPADPLGAQQALGPRPGHGHHAGGSGRSRHGRGAVVENTQGPPGCQTRRTQSL
ncbi:unnamed protein product, partial [Lepidochelys kempii]